MGYNALILHLRPQVPGSRPGGHLQKQDLHGVVRGDVEAASYVQIYVAKEFKNVGPEGTTHLFTKDHGKLSLLRTSFGKE